jgi:GTP pyrophosphokinase
MNEIRQLYRQYLKYGKRIVPKQDVADVRAIVLKAIDAGKISQQSLLKDLNTALIAVTEIGLGRSTVVAVLLHDAVVGGIISHEELKNRFGNSAAVIVKGLIRANELYRKNAAVETENFSKLLLTFAEDVRVIFILIAARLYTIRHLKGNDKETNAKVAREATYLYAPLAHRMGLYKIKSELEDLSLRILEKEDFQRIKDFLSETKDSREKYIADFIAPLKKQLRDAGFDFSIKGRTKSFHSIWNKWRRQNTPLENIYDLFAIRVILRCPVEREKAECWQVYSIVTDKYQPNPKRLRDWLSIPKSNGYESLHTTVMGPEGKWVEVQIRSERMDEIAEKGLAAHWRYKGVKGDSSTDEWLKHIREILENPQGGTEVMDDFRLDLYDDEVFVFTPTGDLQKLKKGATVLDFAFHIHSNLGSKCVGAKINGKAVPIRYVLKNGDQIEILTANNQKPKAEWLHIVTTSKARTKIKQVLKEIDYKEAEQGKEILLRRLKNWKIEYVEADITRLTKKLGYKVISDFYQAIALEKIDMLTVRDELLSEDAEPLADAEFRSAANYMQESDLIRKDRKDDALVIDQNVKGVEYKLASCCNPIYGDDIFGFVTSSGVIKIHHDKCPNKAFMDKFAYRMVAARWAKSDGQYFVALRVTGKDDIGIVTNITSLLSKESKVTMRSISVDAVDGIFQGNITLLVEDTHALDAIIKKIKTIKGVKEVERRKLK